MIWKNNNMLPDFLCIGAQRAATTWVYHCLKEHPEVFVTDEKECHFFDENYEKGLGWYESKFEKGTNYIIRGEITPNYLNTPQSVPRMAKTIPSAKLFVILRDPVWRAYSAYKLFQYEHYEHLSFRQACEKGDYLIKLGLYNQLLIRVYKYYPKTQVKVFLYDQIESDPFSFLKDLFIFLGVNSQFLPPSSKRRYNRIMYPRLQDFLSKSKLDWAVNFVKKTQFGEWLKRKHKTKDQSIKDISDEDVKYLREIFRDDVIALQKTIGQDLSSWL